MTSIRIRQELHLRYAVSKDCRGRGHHVRTGHQFEFRGVDVSAHGFGCVIVGELAGRDVVKLEIGGISLPFEVMWVETYLGIENTYRVGLHCLDRSIDVRAHMSVLGVVTVPVEDGFAA
jgi:hypothetical protein